MSVPPPPPNPSPAGQELPPPPPLAFTQDDGILVSSPDGATEHVLLAVDEVPELRERGQPRSRQLHDEARKLTNKYAQTDYATVGVQADLTLLWSSWKMYIAVHRYADEIIGPGVVSFTAEFIDGTTDPNRGGNPRLDLVVGHLHGGYARLHPGTKPKNDAAPRYFPGSAPEHAADAPEHAADEWRSPAADGIFTLARSNLVPQIDKLGKAHVWRTMETLFTQGLITQGLTTCITNGTRLRWWLWICNLGACTRSVIGIGVCDAYVTMNTHHEAIFEFTRMDASKCMVRLCCSGGGSARDLRMYYREYVSAELQRNMSCGAAEHALPLTRRSTDPKTCTSRTAF